MKFFFFLRIFPVFFAKLSANFFLSLPMRSVKTSGTSLAHPNSKPEKTNGGGFHHGKSADDVVIEYLID
jgi:hypothetical protein